MILISHRGNISGRNPERENDPSYIEEAIKEGFFVEIDLWQFGGTLLLGHDQNLTRLHQISNEWLNDKPLLVHCKNLDALRYCCKHKHLNFFFHKNEEYTVSSKGLLFAHSKTKAERNTICMLPEIHGFSKESLNNCAGICSDIIEFYK